MKKICYQCGEEKPLEMFHRHRGRKDGRNDVCASCATKRVSLYAKTDGAEAARSKYFAEYKEREDVRERMQGYFRKYNGNLTQEQREKYLQTRYRRQDKSPRHRLYVMLYSAAKRRPNDDIATIDDLMKMWEDQKGRCAVSGLQMTWSKEKKDGKKSPTSISLDRIDNEKGYEIGNLRLVCWQVNVFKNNWTDEEMLIMARSIVAKADEQEPSWKGFDYSAPTHTFTVN